MKMPNKRGEEMSLSALRYCCTKLEGSNAVYPKEDQVGLWVMTKTGLIRITNCPFCGEKIEIEDEQ